MHLILPKYLAIHILATGSFKTLLVLIVFNIYLLYIKCCFHTEFYYVFVQECIKIVCLLISVRFLFGQMVQKLIFFIFFHCTFFKNNKNTLLAYDFMAVKKHKLLVYTVSKRRNRTDKSSNISATYIPNIPFNP